MSKTWTPMSDTKESAVVLEYGKRERNSQEHTQKKQPVTKEHVIIPIFFRIFADDINWGRILTLLCFGYRMAIQVLREHLGKFADFLRRIGQFLLKFLITEKISRWIAEHGGWVSACMVLAFQLCLVSCAFCGQVVLAGEVL